MQILLYPNLSLKPVQTDAVLKRNPFMIDQVCAHATPVCQLFSSADLQIHYFQWWFAENCPSVKSRDAKEAAE